MNYFLWKQLKNVVKWKRFFKCFVDGYLSFKIYINNYLMFILMIKNNFYSLHFSMSLLRTYLKPYGLETEMRVFSKSFFDWFNSPRRLKL